jgi:hypothetical protein
MTIIALAGGMVAATLYSRTQSDVPGGEPMFNPTIPLIMWKGMIIVPISQKKAIHIHHWMYYLIIYILCIIAFNTSDCQHIVIGWCVVMIIHGLTYCDRFNFVCPNPYIDN